jgi:hypothetical protein
MGYHSNLWIDATPADIRDRDYTTRRQPTMDLKARVFRVLEFKLRADSAAKMFKNDDTEHYTVFGHDNPTCPAIAEKRRVNDTSLAQYLADHEYFDGELTFAEPWPCSKCIPTESLPKWKSSKDVPKNEHRWMQDKPATPVAKPEPAPPTGENPLATDAQVRKLMALYKKSKPQASREAILAAQQRAKRMTKREASTTISKLEKGEKPAEAHSPVGATSGIAKGATVTNGNTTGRVFWTGTGKNGCLRYGVEYIDANGTKQSTFTDHGWSVVA